jgi:XTP/dITP diphosphohydrolase
MRVIHCVSSNPHKLKEFNNILGPFGYRTAQLTAPKIEIQADNLEEIAIYCLDRLSAVNCFVEDAGLFVDALNGFPGPYSAYVFRTLGCAGLLQLLRAQENRKAHFLSVIAYRDVVGEKKIFQGETLGSITSEERGRGGFGFDPVFIPSGTTKTYAEMTPSEKDTTSHRGKATRALAAFLDEQ